MIREMVMQMELQLQMIMQMELYGPARMDVIMVASLATRVQELQFWDKTSRFHVM